MMQEQQGGPVIRRRQHRLEPLQRPGIELAMRLAMNIGVEQHDIDPVEARQRRQLFDQTIERRKVALHLSRSRIRYFFKFRIFCDDSRRSR